MKASAAELQTTIYFAHLYRSWERGLNENSNGLFWRYFPKGMELTDVTEEQVQRAVARLNHRPRKMLVSDHRMKYYPRWRCATPSQH